MNQQSSGSRSLMLRMIAILFVIVVVTGGGAVWLQSRHGAVRRTIAIPIPVTAVAVQLRDVPIYRSGLGAVAADHSVTITPQVGGKIIAEPFSEGETVSKGQLLVQIDPAPYQAVLDEAIAKENQDKAILEGARQDLDRYAVLVRQNYASAQKYTDQKALVAEETATVTADSAAVEAARINLGFTRITAPIAGRVGLRLIDVGNVVSAGTTSAICTLMQINPIAVIFTLPEQDLGGVLAGMAHRRLTVLIHDASGKTQLAEGKLLTIDNQVNAQNGTFQLKAMVPNDMDRLWPGQFVRVDLRIETLESVAAIPDTALQRGPDGYFVYRIRKNDTVTRVPVSVHARSGDLAVIGGASVGDRIVASGASRLDDGSKVTLITRPPS